MHNNANGDLNLLVGKVAFWDGFRFHPCTRYEYTFLVVDPCRPYRYRAPVPILGCFVLVKSRK